MRISVWSSDVCSSYLAALHDREAVGEGLAGRDAGETDPRHAVLRGRHDQAVPVDRGRLVQLVGDGDRHLLTLLEPQGRPRGLAVVGDRRLRRAGMLDGDLVDDTVVGRRVCYRKSEDSGGGKE